MNDSDDQSYLLPEWPAPENIWAVSTTRSSPDIQNLQPFWLHQVHGNHVVNLDEDYPFLTGDASHTRIPQRICVIKTADCLPILLCNRQGDEVAAIHAGWRGLMLGVINATISSLTSSPNDLLAWLGPAIGPDHFELNEDIRADFLNVNPDYHNAFHLTADGKWFADLYELARINLHFCGVKQVFGGGLCTYCDPEKFYSYRRDKGITGRMSSLICLLK